MKVHSEINLQKNKSILKKSKTKQDLNINRFSIPQIKSAEISAQNFKGKEKRQKIKANNSSSQFRIAENRISGTLARSELINLMQD